MPVPHPVTECACLVINVFICVLATVFFYGFIFVYICVYMLVWTGEGDLYTWGWNESGQLGLPCHVTQRERLRGGIAAGEPGLQHAHLASS